MPSFLKLNYVTRNKLAHLATSNLTAIIETVKNFDVIDTKLFIEIAYNLLFNPVFKSCLAHLQPTLQFKKVLVKKLAKLLSRPGKAHQLLLRHPDLVQQLSKVVVACWGKLKIYND